MMVAVTKTKQLSKVATRKRYFYKHLSGPVVHRHTEVHTRMAACYLENKLLQAAGVLKGNARS